MGQIIITSYDKKALEDFRDKFFPGSSDKVLKWTRDRVFALTLQTEHSESLEMPLDHAKTYLQMIDNGIMKEYPDQYLRTPPFSSQANAIDQIKELSAKHLYQDNHPYIHIRQNTQSLQTNKMVSGDNKLLKGE